MAEIIVVVPCFDEAERLPAPEFVAFAERTPDTEFLFVDDGSRDQTLELLRRLESQHPDRFSVVSQRPNRGKAEAVRAGMLAAFERRPRFAGYWDADLATPLGEIARFARTLQGQPELLAVLGSRVKLLGRSIERRAIRHYLGRVYATAVSLALGLAVYDTQCGAKLFRVCAETRRLFEEPFCVGWSFDVEILARLIQSRSGTSPRDPASAVYELPLRQWHDVPGSKVAPTDFLVGLLEVLRIYRRYGGRAARPARPGG